jgi:hypothetical protein
MPTVTWKDLFGFDYGAACRSRCCFARRDFQYTRNKPNSKLAPMKVALNQGVYTVSRAGVLIIDWNPADGGATRETFSDARQGNMKLRGTSNRYAPLVAAKIA